MPNKKGFTLIEIIIVLIIIGILAAAGLPSYFNMINQGAATAAQNNLTSIYNAEKSYYFTNTSYCTTSSATNAATCAAYANCAANINAINCNLSLTITDNNFSYSCSNASNFTCIATNNTDANLKLTLTNNAIVLPGGSTCASSTGANPGCNPSCATDVNAYCPNN